MATPRLSHAALPQPLGAACRVPRRLPCPPSALQADAAGGPPQERVAALVRQQGGGAALYATGAPGAELAAAVADLVATNASQRPAPDSLTAGQGTWEVGAVRGVHQTAFMSLPCPMPPCSNQGAYWLRLCAYAGPCRCFTPPTSRACHQCWALASNPSATRCEAASSSQMWVVVGWCPGGGMACRVGLFY